MFEDNDLKNFLIKKGASKVGFANIDGLTDGFIDLPYGISLVLKIPKKAFT